MIQVTQIVIGTQVIISHAKVQICIGFKEVDVSYFSNKVTHRVTKAKSVELSFVTSSSKSANWNMLFELVISLIKYSIFLISLPKFYIKSNRISIKKY